MNNPPYIITDVFVDMVADIATKLGRPVYAHYGYVKELNENLMQYNSSPGLFDKKFPLIWLKEPFTINAQPLLYGVVDELWMFIMTGTKKEYKSYERKENTFKPILYPIRDELITQMSTRPEFANYNASLNFKLTDHYYWGEENKSVLNDIVDTIAIRFLKIPVRNNKNCITD